MIALSICCTALTANFYNVLYSAPAAFFCDSVTNPDIYNLYINRGTCPRPCVAAKPRARGEAALRAKARGLPWPTAGHALQARGEAASCRGKAARG